MKLSLHPPGSAGLNVSPESAALAAWYDSNPALRHLWAIKYAQGLRVIIRLEPTLDGDDTLPGWIANSRARAHELQLRTHESVQLEAIDEVDSAENPAVTPGQTFYEGPVRSIRSAGMPVAPSRRSSWCCC